MNQPKLTLVKGDKRPPTRLDWATVEQALGANGNEEEPRTLKFQRLALNKLFGISRQEADDYITDGGDDCGIDCFVVDYNNNKIHLVSTKTVEAYDKAKKNFPGGEVSKLICFVRDLVDRSESLLTRCNPLLRAKVVETWEAIAAGRVFQVCVHACSNQSHLIERESCSLHEGLTEYRAVVFEHHLTRFSEEISKNWSPPISKSLRFIGRELFEHTEGAANDCVKSLVGCVRVSDLYAFLKDDRTAFIDENLFHANVRGNLGIQNPVNRDIAATLRGKDNSKFFCLNNGITIVCEKYLYQSGGFPVTLHRPQIVNGRQTAEVIFNSTKQDPSSIANVVVSVRVIETSDPSFIEEVSVATNSQSRIGTRDLRANSSIAKKLASGLERLGYHYVRKRGEKPVLPPEKTIDALKAGQLILAYVRELPEKAKTDTSSMFGDEFETVFDPHQITPELLLTAHRIFVEIEQHKHRAMLTMRQSGLSAASAEHWLVEGAFHVLYCVGLIAKKENIDLASYEACASIIPLAMDAVGTYFASTDKIAAYRLFRSIKARDDLKKIVCGEVQLNSLDARQYALAF